MQTETVPVVIGALRVVKKGLDKYMERNSGAVIIKELQ